MKNQKHKDSEYERDKEHIDLILHIKIMDFQRRVIDFIKTYQEAQRSGSNIVFKNVR